MVIFALILVAGTAIMAFNFANEIDDNRNKVGGEESEQGCLVAAGYSWNESVGACVREWELDNNQRKAVKTALAPLSYPVTVVEASKQEGEGNYNVKLQRNDNRSVIIDVKIKDWQIENNEQQKNTCTEQSRQGEFCTEQYHAVCGWFKSNVRCIKYPCAQTFSNECFACHNENVDYWTEGECPA